MAQFHPHESYDYIVVGSGASGAVVAARLSENPAHQVLLIEAGPDDTSPWIGVPLGFARVLANPDYMWRYESGPEKALDNRSLAMWRGKLLGGSTSVNGMIYLRGAPYDYDLWRQMGAVGWSYEDVLPYFRKAETQSRGADEHHGGTGPLHVEDVRWRTPLSDAFIDASASAGVPRIHDFNREDIEGVGYFQFTTHRGSRASTARTYLKSARRRRNLASLKTAWPKPCASAARAQRCGSPRGPKSFSPVAPWARRSCSNARGLAIRPCCGSWASPCGMTFPASART